MPLDPIRTEDGRFTHAAVANLKSWGYAPRPEERPQPVVTPPSNMSEPIALNAAMSATHLAALRQQQRALQNYYQSMQNQKMVMSEPTVDGQLKAIMKLLGGV